MKCRIRPYPVVSKGTESRQNLLSARTGYGVKEVIIRELNQGKKKEVSYGKFSCMEWMRQRRLYERGFLNTAKEAERNSGMS